MKFRGTLVTLAVAALLGGFVYLHEVRGGRERARARDKLRRLVDVERSRIRALRITHSGQTFDLELRSGGWALAQPVSAPCDPAVVGAFLDTLLAARREDRVGRGKLQRYGLDAPASRIEVDAGGEKHVLALGRVNPVQTLVYALVDDSEDVLLTTSALLALSLNNSFGWRDKSMIDVQPELVGRMRYRTLVTDPASLRRDPKIGWVAEGAVAWRADPVRSQSALLGLCRLKAVGVAAENKEDLRRFGLDNRRFGAQLELANGKVVGDVVFGQAEAEGAYFAIVPDKPEVFRVEGRLADLIVGLARDPRDRKALPPFDQAKITQIRVVAPEDRFVLRRKSGTDWVVASSQKVDSTFALDASRMAGLLENLATLEVNDFPAKQPGRSASDPPTLSVRLYEGEKQVSGIEFGSKDPHGLFTFARGPDEPAVFLLSPAALLRVPFALERLKAEESPAPANTNQG